MKLLVLTTGGTIDSAPYPENGPSPELSTPLGQSQAVMALQEMIAASGKPITLNHIQITNKDSKLIAPADFDMLEHAIIANQDKYDRIIVTIGTDCMTETAQHLQSRLYDPPDCPVIFTGAIWPLMNNDRTDGRDNLHLALFGDPDALPGVYIAMHDLFLPCTGP